MLLFKHHVNPAYLINYSNKRATAISVKRNFEIGSEFYGTRYWEVTPAFSK